MLINILWEFKKCYIFTVKYLLNKYGTMNFPAKLIKIHFYERFDFLLFKSDNYL